MERIIKTFSFHSAEYKKALDLRYRILRKPLQLKFTEQELKNDQEDIHLGLFEEEKILACLILSKGTKGRIKMRQVAVDNQIQQQGLGRKLSDAAEMYAKENGFRVIWCNARKTAVPFYKKLGYKIVSDEFVEVNIPHYKMEKQILI